MILRRDDSLRGIDDFVDEVALAKRVRQRGLAGTSSSLCGRRFTHPREPTHACACLRPSSHEEDCVCEHGIERRVFRVDPDGREHCATRPLGGRTR
jgi:hypothetical protein